MGTQDRNDLEHTDDDDMGCAEQLEAIYAKWERRIEERGEKKGIKKGLEMGMEEGLNRGLAKGLEMGIMIGLEQGFLTALADVYQARFGALPAALRTALEATKDLPPLRGWTALFSTATADEIAATVLPAGRRSGAPRRANKTGKARPDAGRARDRQRTSRSARPSE